MGSDNDRHFLQTNAAFITSPLHARRPITDRRKAGAEAANQQTRTGRIGNTGRMRNCQMLLALATLRFSSATRTSSPKAHSFVVPSFSLRSGAVVERGLCDTNERSLHPHPNTKNSIRSTRPSLLACLRAAGFLIKTGVARKRAGRVVKSVPVPIIRQIPKR